MTPDFRLLDHSKCELVAMKDCGTLVTVCAVLVALLLGILPRIPHSLR